MEDEVWHLTSQFTLLDALPSIQTDLEQQQMQYRDLLEYNVNL